MFKQVALFLCVLVAASSMRFRQPRDLVDEVVVQLTELKNIVQGDILAAHDNLDTILTEFTADAQTVSSSAEVDLQQQQQSIESQLTSIKELANSAGEDISSCTDLREEILNRLVGDYSLEMNDCITDINTKVTQMLRDARYIVDVVINKVHDLEYQVNQCQGSLLCLSPLLTEIQLSKIRLPQNIATEVQAADTLVNLDKVSVQNCADTAVTGYTSESFSILSDIMDCVNEILGKH